MINLILISILIFIVGIVYQLVSTKIDRRRYPPSGEMIKIGNRFIHVIQKKIFDHGPTIILEAGNGLSSTSWMLVQPEIEKFANCISYDRAGLGWSERNPGGSTILNDVADLYNLLSYLELPKPYILVGHSYGGLINRLYASQFKDDIVGIVLVDAFHEDQLKYIPLPSPLIMRIFSIISFFGIFRLFIKKLFPLPKNLPTEMQNRIYAENSKFSWLTKMREMFSNVEQILSSVTNLPITDIQMAVISAGLHDGMELKFKNEICGLQKDLVKKSINAYQIIAENSAHNIPFAQPEIIVETIKKMVVNLVK